MYLPDLVNQTYAILESSSWTKSSQGMQMVLEPHFGRLWFDSKNQIESYLFRSLKKYINYIHKNKTLKMYA